MMDPACVAMVAGEASGDALGANLIRQLKALRPELAFVGIGGPRMEAAGCDIWWPAEKLAVRGYAEVIRHLAELLAVRRRLARRLLKNRPGVFVGIDAPDFNLGLETKLKSAGIRTVHYVSPSLWAWRADRIKGIGAAVDHMLALFPFETEIYKKAGIPVSCVGHPLASSIPLIPDRVAVRERFRLAPSQPIFAMLPGSRQSELELHTDIFLATIRLLHEQYQDAQFLVPLVSRSTRQIFERALYQIEESLPVTVLYGHADAALTAADVALVASGTATLEAALLKCPHVITYRLSSATAMLVRRKLRSPFIGLPNMLCGQFVVPEILQEAATPENLAQAMSNLYADKGLRAELVGLFEDLHHYLQADTTYLAAQVVLGQLAPPRSSDGA